MKNRIATEQKISRWVRQVILAPRIRTCQAAANFKILSNTSAACVERNWRFESASRARSYGGWNPATPISGPKSRSSATGGSSQLQGQDRMEGGTRRPRFRGQRAGVERGLQGASSALFRRCAAPNRFPAGRRRDRARPIIRGLAGASRRLNPACTSTHFEFAPPCQFVCRVSTMAI